MSKTKNLLYTLEDYEKNYPDMMEFIEAANDQQEFEDRMLQEQLCASPEQIKSTFS